MNKPADPSVAAATLAAITAPTREVSHGLNLVMRLRDKNLLAELMGQINARRERVRMALAELNYLHFSRFLPLWEDGLLLVITEFDGDFDDYVMDFAAVLDDEFSLILSYMQDPPPLPVSRYPREFLDYITRCSKPEKRIPPLPANKDPSCPYPDKTVLDILGDRAFVIHGAAQAARKAAAAVGGAGAGKPGAGAAGANVDRDDVQANILEGFRATAGVHVAIRFAGNSADEVAASGRALLSALTAASAPAGQPAALAVSAATLWQQQPEYCLNLGLTYGGIAALGVDAIDLRAFPPAFREGPAARAERLGDKIGSDGPQQWKLGGEGDAAAPHALLSLYARDDAAFATHAKALVDLLDRHGARRVYEREVHVLDASGHLVHFGYQDALSQPRVDVRSAQPHKRVQAQANPLRYTGATIPAGDILLGVDYVNSRNGNFIGRVPPQLGNNGTYGAFRVIEQDVEAFEKALAAAAAQQGADPDPDRVAARLMGRWRNGAPLVRHPDSAPAYSATDEDFDFGEEDAAGARCPMGAHVRRLNPRGSLVVGVPTGRQVIRRGMPYGAAYIEGELPKVERGLAGMFICADLESQYEFVLRVWANGDLSAPGLRNTRDPFVGSPMPDGTTFRWPAMNTEDASKIDPSKPPIEIKLPQVTRTTGSLYVFMPGMGALRCLAAGAGRSRSVAGPAASAGGGSGMKPSVGAPPVARGCPVALPGSVGFRADPYPFFRAQRSRDPMFLRSAVDVTGPDGTARRRHEYWVLGRALLDDVAARPDTFVKPGRNPQAMPPNHVSDNGLFFMNGADHARVRPAMRAALDNATQGIETFARATAKKLIGDILESNRFGTNGEFDIVKAYARPLPLAVFAQWMGVPVEMAFFVEKWVDAMMGGRGSAAPPAARLNAGMASNAASMYFRSLIDSHASGAKPSRPRPGTTAAGACPMARAMQGLLPNTLRPDEAMLTAMHLALGGYESTAFLITTGTLNLLRHPDEMAKLRSGKASVERAVDEMLRYDAPFSMSDREVAKACTLGGKDLGEGDTIQLVFASANRDLPGVADAEAFVVDRVATGGMPDAFGADGHHCLGAKLARTVGRIAFEELLGAFRTLRLVSVGEWLPDPSLRSVASLEVSVR